MQTLGYIRVSSTKQNLDLQRDAMTQAGCDRVFEDEITSRVETRVGLDQLLAHVRPGDTVLVWKLDRIGRTFNHLRDLITYFNKNDIKFRSLTEGFDTSTDTGMLMFNLMGIFAEYERNLINERIRAGIKSARDRGKKEALSQNLNPLK